MSVGNVQCQQIKTGEQCPEFKIGSTLQYRDTVSLSDFRNKLLILDFWNTTCISCIKAFPKLDSIQKLFGNRVQIVLVNRESKDSTIAFFKNTNS
ncbi:MAG: redoxin domain-containing protein [Chitinophagaceae bacterium]|nr:redoxin domain-containing protein [Chitinophagaceae bacterium]